MRSARQQQEARMKIEHENVRENVKQAAHMDAPPGGSAPMAEHASHKASSPDEKTATRDNEVAKNSPDAKAADPESRQQQRQQQATEDDEAGEDTARVRSPVTNEAVSRQDWEGPTPLAGGQKKGAPSAQASAVKHKQPVQQAQRREEQEERREPEAEGAAAKGRTREGRSAQADAAGAGSLLRHRHQQQREGQEQQQEADAAAPAGGKNAMMCKAFKGADDLCGRADRASGGRVRSVAEKIDSMSGGRLSSQFSRARAYLESTSSITIISNFLAFLVLVVTTAVRSLAQEFSRCYDNFAAGRTGWTDSVPYLGVAYDGLRMGKQTAVTGVRRAYDKLESGRAKQYVSDRVRDAANFADAKLVARIPPAAQRGVRGLANAVDNGAGKAYAACMGALGRNARVQNAGKWIRSKLAIANNIQQQQQQPRNINQQEQEQEREQQPHNQPQGGKSAASAPRGPHQRVHAR